MKRIQRFKDQILFSLCCLCPTFSSVLAGSGEAVSEVNGLINKLYTPIKYIGFLITIYAVGMLILEMRSENFDSISKRITQVCIGIVLYGLKSFMS